MLIKSIMRIVVVAMLAIFKSSLKFVIFFFRCIVFCFFFNLEYISSTYFIVMRLRLHSHVVVTTSNTCFLYKN